MLVCSAGLGAQIYFCLFQIDTSFNIKLFIIYFDHVMSGVR